MNPFSDRHKIRRGRRKSCRPELGAPGLSTFDAHNLAAAGMLLAVVTIAAGFFILTISGGYPRHNGPWLLAHSFSLSHAADNAAICSAISFSVFAAFIVAIGLFRRRPLTGASSKPEIFPGGQPAKSVRRRRSNDGFYNAIAFSN